MTSDFTTGAPQLYPHSKTYQCHTKTVTNKVIEVVLHISQEIMLLWSFNVIPFGVVIRIQHLQMQYKTLCLQFVARVLECTYMSNLRLFSNFQVFNIVLNSYGENYIKILISQLICFSGILERQR